MGVSARRARLHGEYVSARAFEARWREAAAQAGARETVAGRSVEGRPVWRFELGSAAPEAPTVLLTGLVHGVELIGAVALLDVFQKLAGPASHLRERARFVVMPMVNPDALATNMDRLERGRTAGRRKNANGVDLNRNFPTVGRPRGWGRWHPFSGSSLKFSPHYRGPHPLSEPESRAVHDVAHEVRPDLAVGFHSFGNMLLYPWAHSPTPNPRLGRYQRLARAFTRAVTRVPYRVRQAVDFYPTVGDLDDWLDATFGTLALTVEVGGLDRRLFHPLRLINTFCWMNPTRAEPTVNNLSPGVMGLMGAALVV